MMQPVLAWGAMPSRGVKFFYQYHYGGQITTIPEEALLVIGKQGHVLMGNYVIFYWIVEKTMGKILEARFQYYGHPYLMMLAEVTCSLVVGKGYAQAYKLSVDDIDQALHTGIRPKWMDDYLPLYHMILDALDMAVEQCMAIPTEGEFRELVLPSYQGDPYAPEEWEAMPSEERLSIIQDIIKEKIAPYIALDGGGVYVKAITGNEITISYMGSCSHCFSAIGSTLDTIGQLLRSCVYSELLVRVDEQSLSYPSD